MRYHAPQRGECLEIEQVFEGLQDAVGNGQMGAGQCLRREGHHVRHSCGWNDEQVI
jgi:hypothetical protein